MTIVSRLLALSLVAASGLGAGAYAGVPARPQANAEPPWVGTWRNTNNTLHIKAMPCGDGDMCGTVVWANQETTQQVAQKKGRSILGMQLFREFHQTGPNEWKGTVYVPTIDRNFSGKITVADRNQLVSVGCLFLGIGCQTRHWWRIS